MLAQFLPLGLSFLLFSCGNNIDCTKANSGLNKCVAQFEAANPSATSTLTQLKAEQAGFQSRCDQAKSVSITDNFKKQVDCLKDLENKADLNCATLTGLNQTLAIASSGSTAENSCRVFYGL